MLGSSEDMLVLWTDSFCFGEAGEEVGILKLFLIRYSLDISYVPVIGCFVYSRKLLPKNNSVQLFLLLSCMSVLHWLGPQYDVEVI